MDQQGEIMIWSKKRNHKDPYTAHHVTSLYDDSWEEQAFAEDAAGCLWPPRSYSCSFCRREFRSAQALGGHMNVHRRDRARLKQADHTQNPNNHHFVSPKEPNPSPCTLVFSHNPSSNDLSCKINLAPKPSSATPRVLNPDLPRKENHMEIKSLFPSSSHSSVIQHRSKRPLISSSMKHSRPPNLVTHDKYHGLISDPWIKEEKEKRRLESGCRAKLELNTELSVSLNFLVHQTSGAPAESHEELTIDCKRRRISEDSSSQPLDLRSSIDSSELKKNPIRSEDLDLELRLGDPTKMTCQSRPNSRTFGKPSYTDDGFDRFYYL